MVSPVRLPSAHSSAKPTLRQIAAKAGVSVVAVSCALRGNPGVSESTRMRIRSIAESLGYRPDPILSQLMFHLRSRRRPKGLHNIAFIHWPKDRIRDAILEGARRQADRHGYHMDVIVMSESAPNPRVLNRMLRARGVAGLVLGPSGEKNLGTLLDWSGFAVILTEHSTSAPNFHRVVPNQTSAMGMALDELLRRGCKRVGLITEEPASSAHGAAFAWLTAQRRMEPLVRSFDRDRQSLAELSAWFRSSKPDGLILPESQAYQTEIVRAIDHDLPGKMEIISLGHDGPQAGVTSVNYRPHLLGEIAIDQLVNQLHRNERGIPQIQQTLSVEVELIPPSPA